MKKIILTIVLICFGMATSGFAETILTIEKVRERALEYNRQLQSAKKELDRSSAEIISARSGALPQISLEGRYTRNMKLTEAFFPMFCRRCTQLTHATQLLCVVRR